MLRPLEQWICDYCGEVIGEPRQGMLEWLHNTGDTRRWVAEFRIVHNPAQSAKGGCYHHEGKYGRADMHLSEMVGGGGLVHLLAFIDAGPYHDPQFKHGPEVKDWREFTEVMRRLFVPYYEEARKYWKRAIADEVFDGANEVWVYHPDTSRMLVEKYGSNAQTR